MQLTLSLVLMLALPFSAQAQTQSTLENDLNYGVNSPITSEQRAEIKNRLDSIKNSANTSVEPEIVGAPDYRVARQNLQDAIASGVINYLNTLGAIDTQLRGLFSKLAGLDQQVKNGVLMRELFENEVNRLIPGTSTSINASYASALNELYLVHNAYIPVIETKRTRKHGTYTYGPTKTDVRETSNLGCITGACAMKILDDLLAWYEFVDSLNSKITILNFKTQVTASNKTIRPFVSEAITASIEKMLAGPQDNISYNLGNYLVKILEVPAQYVLKFGASPYYLFETVGRVAAKIWDTQFLKLSLNLNPIESYSLAEISEAVVTKQREFAKAAPAVLYGDQITRYNINPNAYNGFDEVGYLKRYPDVAEAVRNGGVSSGRDHYERWGKTEGRIPY